MPFTPYKPTPGFTPYKSGIGKQAPLVAPITAPPKKPTILQNVGNALVTPDEQQQIKDAAGSGVGQIKSGISGATKAKNPLQLFENSLKLGAGVVNTAFSPLAPIFKPLGDAVNYAGDKISNIPAVQKFANTKVGQATSRAAEDVGNLDTIAAAVAGSKTAMGKVAEATPAIKANLTDRYVGQATKEWTKPTTIPNAAYTKATEIFNKAKDTGHNIADTLVKNKINLQDNIEKSDTGALKYSTVDTAENLRADAAKLSKELLRPSLEKADLYVPKTPVRDVIKTALDNLEKNKFITTETKDLIKNKIIDTGMSLQKAHPDGLSLTDLHDEKIVRDLNSKYSPVGDIATNNEALKNKTLADSARTTLEKNAPKNIPIKKFNGELTKQFQAANYLDALNTKKVPTSLGSRIAKSVAKIGGAAVGHTIGGGLLGGVGGYHVGGVLEGMIENLPNPVKNHFLNNLEVSNPEAFNAVRNAKFAPEQKLLPASSGGINQKSVTANPIALGEKAPSTLNAEATALNNKVSANEANAQYAPRSLSVSVKGGDALASKIKVFRQQLGLGKMDAVTPTGVGVRKINPDSSVPPEYMGKSFDEIQGQLHSDMKNAANQEMGASLPSDISLYKQTWPQTTQDAYAKFKQVFNAWKDNPEDTAQLRKTEAGKKLLVKIEDSARELDLTNDEVFTMFQDRITHEAQTKSSLGNSSK